MCDPITAILGLVGVGSSLAAASQKTVAPPPAQTPAVSAPTNVKDTTVKLGSDSNASDTASSAPQVTFAERRVQGTSLGKLGRSGLAL